MRRFTRAFARTAKQAKLIIITGVIGLQSLSLIALPSKVFAATEAISGGSNTTGETDVYIPITGVTVTGDAGDTVPVNMSVDRGQLSMTTTTGLTFTGSPTGSTLIFEGTVANVNAALATLRYRTTYAETIDFTAQLTSPGEVYFPGNGHIYEVVSSPGITADDALTAAAGRTKYGVSGYLATITTQAENDYVGPRLGGDGWFGARDSDVEGDWEWATGPESGTVFYRGLGNSGGAPVGGLYSNWASGEPNDAGNEDCAQFYSSGSGWNDLPCTGAALDYYVVEYGEDGQAPTVSNTSFTITTVFPDPNDIPIGSCLDLIDVAENQNDHRYDNLQLTGNVDCTGETLEPMFSDTDPDLGLQTFRGVFDGQGHTITGIDIDEGGDSAALFANTNGATIRNLTLAGGSVSGGDCTGALASSAYDTAIQNVTSSVSVDGSNSTGGLVGCYNVTGDDTSMTDNTVSGTVHGNQYIGGLIGNASVDGGYTFTLDTNTWSGTMTADNDWVYGGLVGEMNLDNESEVSMKHNTSKGVSIDDAYGVGGLVGTMELEEQSTATIEANTITDDIGGSGDIGGLVGELYLDESRTTITNSTQPRNVIGDDGYVGGLVGELYLEGDEESDTKLTISNSSTSGDITGDYEVGGLLGEAYGDYGDERVIIANSHATGDITASDGYVGGLAGYLEIADITDSYATGTITSGDYRSGGLAGSLEDSTITDSYSTSNIVSGSDTSGGLVGDAYNIDVLRSFATGTVTGYGSIGGLVGNFGSGSIADSYARGSVDAGNTAGGLVGTCQGDILSSYATGEVTVDGGDVGGLVGYDSGCTTDSSFWDTETSGQASSGGGTGKTTVEMKTISTFTDTDNSDGLNTAWDFDDVWGVVASINDGYPCLLWYNESCDDDADGASTPVEEAAPNGGDANNDGASDAEQGNVASFVNPVSEAYTTIALPSACGISSATAETEGSQSTQDAGYQYQSGLVHFTADCGTPGYTTTVKVYLYGVPMAGLVLRKYNPNTHAYFTISSAVLTQQTIGGQTVTVAAYSITDGGDLDTDGTVNGIIVDPVGLASGAVGAPNTGLGGHR